MAKVNVSWNDDASRFEAMLDGERVGLLDVQRQDGVWVMPHTEVDPAQEGKGIGGTLVKTALDAARIDSVRVVPSCPFVAAWIRRHPDYRDLTEDVGSDEGYR